MCRSPEKICLFSIFSNRCKRSAASDGLECKNIALKQKKKQQHKIILRYGESFVYDEYRVLFYVVLNCSIEFFFRDFNGIKIKIHRDSPPLIFVLIHFFHDSGML